MGDDLLEELRAKRMAQLQEEHKVCFFINSELKY